MSEDAPLAFNILFTIPRMASAYARHPDGGARMKIDIEESCVGDANAMLDLMVKRAGTTFAAVVVVVREESSQAAEPTPSVVDWRDTKRRKLKN